MIIIIAIAIAITIAIATSTMYLITSYEDSVNIMKGFWKKKITHIDDNTRIITKYSNRHMGFCHLLQRKNNKKWKYTTAWTYYSTHITVDNYIPYLLWEENENSKINQYFNIKKNRKETKRL